MSDQVVYYRSPNIDTFTAAWLLDCYNIEIGTEATFIPMRHGVGHPEIWEGRDVVVLGFCFKGNEYMHELIHRSNSVIVFDNHEENREIIDEMNDLYEDYDFSGEVQTDMSITAMVWDYSWAPHEMPDYIEYIDDQAVAHNALEDSEAFCAGLKPMERKFINWNQLKNPNFVKETLEEGWVLLAEAKKRYMRQINKTHQDIWLDMPDGTMRKVLLTNARHVFDMIGQANMMSEMNLGDLVGTYYHRKSGEISVTLVSKPNGLDVGPICRSYGGGCAGPHLGGFPLSVEKWEALVGHTDGLRKS